MKYKFWMTVKTCFFILLCTAFTACAKDNGNMGSTPMVAALDGSYAQINGQLIASVAYDGFLYLSYSGGNGASYDIGETVVSSQVTGLTASLEKGTLKNGIGHLVYKLAGTPNESGTALFSFSFGGQNTTVQLSVTQNTQNVTDLLYWGFFDDAGTDISTYEAYGKKPSMMMMFDGWSLDGDKSFPTTFCQTASANGYVPHITWEPVLGLDTLISGKFDADIEQYAAAMKAFGKPVVLRFAHEFNGDWYTWSINDNELVTTEKYVKAFRYVHDKIKAAGADNVSWIWAPNNVNGAKNPQSLKDYYPGDDYVDIIGIDGYNFGTSQSWSSWQSFSDVFGTVYDWILTNHPNKPIIISEMGTSSVGGDKAAWITDMFTQLSDRFSKVKGFVWFNINKETDWRFTETTPSLNAFKTGLSGSRVVYDSTFGGIIK